MKRFKTIIIPLLLLSIWEGAVRLHLFPPSHAAAPSAVVVRMFSLVFSFELVWHAIFSLKRLFLAVVIGATFGILTSSCLAFSKVLDRLFSPTLQLLAGIPVVVWIPFWVMFFGTDEVFKIAMVAIATYFLVHTSNFQTVRSIPTAYLELCDMYETKFWGRMYHIFLPYSTPAIITALRISLTFGWVVLFFVEYASARHGSEGLGWFIADSRAMGRVESEFAGLLFLGIIAFSVDSIISVVEFHFTKWTDTVKKMI